jgi:hypothetical protein
MTVHRLLLFNMARCHVLLLVTLAGSNFSVSGKSAEPIFNGRQTPDPQTSHCSNHMKTDSYHALESNTISCDSNNYSGGVNSTTSTPIDISTAPTRSANDNSFLGSIFLRRMQPQKPHTLALHNSHGWKSTTLVSGGANPSSSAAAAADSDDGTKAVNDIGKEETDPMPSTKTTTPKSRHKAVRPTTTKTFLGKLGLKAERPSLPKTLTGIKRQMRDGLEGTLQNTSRVGPTILTSISLLFVFNEKGVSFATLYVLALLGASCGFHLFLYFITLGYALGVSVPLVAALYVYNVSIYYYQYTDDGGEI